MVEILTDTEQRLVIALGPRSRRNWTKAIFDRVAGRAWFEQHRPMWPERTKALAFSDIASIDAATAPGLTGRTACLVVTDKVGSPGTELEFAL